MCVCVFCRESRMLHPSNRVRAHAAQSSLCATQGIELYWHIPGTVCNRISIAADWITWASFFLLAIFLCEMCIRFFAIQYFLLLFFFFFFCTSKSSNNNKPTKWGVHLFTCTRVRVCLYVRVCVCVWIKVLNIAICYSIPFTYIRPCCMQRVYEYNVTNMHRLIVLQGVS